MSILQKLLAGACSLLLVCGFFGCSATPQTTQEASQPAAAIQEPITISVKVPTLSMNSILHPEITSAYEFLQVAAEAFEATWPQGTVQVNVTEFPIEEETALLGNTIGTSDAPDVLYEGYFNMSSYIHSGSVVPLDDIISEELRADIADTYWEMSQVDGKTYMMPYLSSTNTLAFNKELFDQAGLSEFTEGAEDSVLTWSPDEWETILSTLRENLSDTQYPMMMYAASDQGDTHIMTLLRSKGADFYDENGNFNINTPEGIEALRWIKESYDLGYFPEGADTLSINNNYDLFLNGQLAIYMSNSAQDEGIREDGNFEPYSVNFPAPEDGLANSFVTGFEVFDNGDKDKLQLAKQFVSFIMNGDLLDYSVGSLPVSNRIATQYASELSGVQKYIEDADAVWNFTNNHPNWRGVRNVFYTHIQDLLFGSATPEEVAAAIDADCNAAIEEGYTTSTLHK